MSHRLHLDTADGRIELNLAPTELALPLTDLLARRGHALNTRCGGRGLCGGCEVGLRSGELQRTSDGSVVTPAAGDRLRACQLRVGPGEGCSFGNAGGVAFAEIMPTVHPRIFRKLPGWLMDPLGPLTIRWSYLPKALPWFLAAARNATPARVESIVQSRAPRARSSLPARGSTRSRHLPPRSSRASSAR